MENKERNIIESDPINSYHLIIEGDIQEIMKIVEESGVNVIKVLDCNEKDNDLFKSIE